MSQGKTEGGLEKVLANLWRGKRITKNEKALRCSWARDHLGNPRLKQIQAIEFQVLLEFFLLR